jgi:coniferyl-aldehyde dehydrogenase
VSAAGQVGRSQLSDGIGAPVGAETDVTGASAVGSDLPFSIIGSAAPPFRKSMKIYADTALGLARNMTRRRLGRSNVSQGEGEQR